MHAHNGRLSHLAQVMRFAPGLEQRPLGLHRTLYIGERDSPLWNRRGIKACAHTSCIPQRIGNQGLYKSCQGRDPSPPSAWHRCGGVPQQQGSVGSAGAAQTPANRNGTMTVFPQLGIAHPQNWGIKGLRLSSSDRAEQGLRQAEPPS